MLLDRVDGSVDAGPGHHFGVHELASGAAHFPQAVVGFIPMSFEPVEDSALDFPCGVEGLEAGFAGQVETVEDFTPDVELQLIRGEVPNPDWSGGVKAGQPRQ